MVKTVFITPTVPTVARRQCARPVQLPDRDLAAKEVTQFWGRDRAALVICENRRKAAINSMSEEQ